MSTGRPSHMEECMQCGDFYRVDAEYRWSTCRKCHDLNAKTRIKEEHDRIIKMGIYPMDNIRRG